MIKDIITDKEELELPCRPIPKEGRALAAKIVEDLIDTAQLWQRRPIGCLGLAANQIGYPYNVVVIWHCGNFMALINPVMEAIGKDTVFKGEGCLSFPGVQKKVKRFKKINVTFNILKRRDPVTVRYTGMTARIIQHELEHLVGKHL